MFVLIYEGEEKAAGRFRLRGRPAIEIEGSGGLRRVHALKTTVCRRDIQGDAGAARRLARMASVLAELSCGTGICAESFGEHSSALLRVLGLREPDVRPLMRALAGRMALTALGSRECELAAVYANRLTREVAEAVALLSPRSRSIALMLREDSERCADVLYAQYGVAAVCAEGVAAEAELHLLFEPPRNGFSAGPNSVAVSLCGELPGLPPESYTSADIRPSEEFCPSGFRPVEIAAALYAQRELAPKNVRIVKLLGTDGGNNGNKLC